MLRTLSTAPSGPQIARELIVSLHTLRTHTRRIFDKLSVNSRVSAVLLRTSMGWTVAVGAVGCGQGEACRFTGNRPAVATSFVG